jgi:lysophospholipase L1-like esterase
MLNKHASTQKSTQLRLAGDSSKSALSSNHPLDSALVHKLANKHSKAPAESTLAAEKRHNSKTKHSKKHSKAKHHKRRKPATRSLLSRSAIGDTLQFSNFADTSSLMLNGSSSKVGNVLRLTPAQKNQAGSAFAKTPYSIDDKTSFNTHFQFRLSGGDGNGGADGITFMLQNSAAGGTALGTLGGGEGYSTIGSSLAIEFDSFKSGWDINANQVSLLKNGDVTTPLATANTPMDLNSSGAINAWIDYDGLTNQLSVFLANGTTGTTKPAAALLKTQADLTAIGAQAYVGFSAGTGGLTNLQDIENWQFAISTPAPTPTPTPTPIPSSNVIQATNASETLTGTTNNDTVSYANASNGITADLKTGTSSRIARIMPLGDSITLGVTDNSSFNKQVPAPFPFVGKGGYRAVLWNKFQQNNLAIDFVGTQSDGTAVGDKDHEGHGGKTIDWLSDRITGFLSTTNPDIVLLMAGTNDTYVQSGILDTAQQMADQLSGLIDKIFAYSSNTKVQVATIAPIRSDAQDYSGQSQKGKDFNNLIPGIVASKRAAGKNVAFVDTRSQTLGTAIGLTDEDIVHPETSRVHPNDGGYDKIGNLWFNSLNSTIGTAQGTYKVDQDTLISIENLIGSVYNDTFISGSGSNVLTGNGGADTFFYRASSDGNDTITDFGTDDRFQISASGFGSGLAAGVALGAAASTGVLVNGTAAISANATFLYGNGSLWFDADGTGAGSKVKIADLSTQPASLSASQFNIVA